MKEAIAALTAMPTTELRAGLKVYEILKELPEEQVETALAVAAGLVTKNSKERKPKAKKAA